MRFLYSGANAYLLPQTNPSLSLGGFVSSSIVPNGRLNGLFSDGSYKASKFGSIETKALILENETQTGVTNITFGYQYSTDPDFKIEVAVVTLSNNQTMEQLQSIRDTPYYGTFHEANVDPDNNIDNRLDLGDMAAGLRLGIWIRRTQFKHTNVLPTDFSVITEQIVNSVSFKLDWN